MSPSWRHPFFAPLYAGLISFVFVVLFGAVLGPPPQTEIRPEIKVVVDGVGALPPELAGLAIEIRNPDRTNEKVGGGKLDKGSYTPEPEVPVVNHLVCIQRPPAPWIVTEPATKDVTVDPPNPVTCTEKPISNPPDREIVLKVKRATVRAIVEGPPPKDVPGEFAGVVVEIREPGGGAIAQMGALDARGEWVPPMSIGNRLVCLKPPAGWMFIAPPTDDPKHAAPQGTKCAPAPGGGIVFILGRTR